MKMRSKMRAIATSVFEMAGRPEMDVSMATTIIQSRVLHALFSNLARDIFLVKGGIAMQMLSENKRSTVDIDLAADPAANITMIASKMRPAINHALSCGLIEDFSVREQDLGGGGLSPKWHINGRLAGTESPVHITIEVSRRDLLPEDAISRFEYQPPKEAGVGRFMARTYSPMAMAAAKVAALLDSKRYKPRDLYDLFILIEMKVEPPVAMLAAMGHEKIQAMSDFLWAKIDSFSYDDYLNKVAPHLPDTVAKKIDEDAWEIMQIKVGQKIETWLEAADKIAGEPCPRDDLRNRYDELKRRADEIRSESSSDSSRNLIPLT